MKQTQRLLARREEIIKQISSLKKSFKQIPLGKLAVYKGKYGFRWYFLGTVKKGEKAEEKYIPKGKRSFAEQLALKTYHMSLLEDLEEELRAIDSYIGVYQSTRRKKKHLLTSRAEELVQNPGFLELLPESIAQNEKKNQQWLEESYHTLEDFRSEKKIKIKEGLYVRSKSEAMIAKALEQYHIPYRYECELTIGDKVVYPDFTIRHPKTGEVLYWEHFGIMDDQGYVQNCARKIISYSRMQIYPMKNLIITSEDYENPLSPDLVYTLVEHFFQ